MYTLLLNVENLSVRLQGKTFVYIEYRSKSALSPSGQSILLFLLLPLYSPFRSSLLIDCLQNDFPIPEGLYPNLDELDFYVVDENNAYIAETNSPGPVTIYEVSLLVIIVVILQLADRFEVLEANKSSSS